MTVSRAIRIRNKQSVHKKGMIQSANEKEGIINEKEMISIKNH